MTDLDALLAGIVAHPHEAVRWLIVADWLDDHGQTDRAELLRLHRMLIDTCCEPDAHPDRAAWQARIVELIDRGVKPCVPQHTLVLPGGVPLVGHFIPPGSFLMGDDRSWVKDEKPVHKVTITKGFFMGVHPVTQLQAAVVRGLDPGGYDGDDFPESTTSWEDAVDFCNEVSQREECIVRLPTEAEWEYACRAGTTTPFHFGTEVDAKRMNYYATVAWNGSAEGKGEYRGKTTKVGVFPPNPWGLCDCHGNVFERCSDEYDPAFYQHTSVEDPECTSAPLHHHVLRGGAYNVGPRGCTSSARDGDVSRAFIGFRVVFILS